MQVHWIVFLSHRIQKGNRPAEYVGFLRNILISVDGNQNSWLIRDLGRNDDEETDYDLAQEPGLKSAERARKPLGYEYPGKGHRAGLHTWMNRTSVIHPSLFNIHRCHVYLWYTYIYVYSQLLHCPLFHIFYISLLYRWDHSSDKTRSDLLKNAETSAVLLCIGRDVISTI